MRFSMSIVCALAGLLAIPLPAAAQDQSVITVAPRVPAGFPARVRERLAREGPERLQAAGVQVRSGADIEVAARAAADCLNGTCLHERLRATGARAAARLELRQTEAGYTAVLDVVSLRSGQSLAHEEADCAGCTDLAVAEVALSLIAGVEIPETDPPQSGPSTTVVNEPFGANEVPPEALRPEPSGHVSRRTSPVVWGALGVGVFLAVGSIPLLLLDGEVTCDGPRQSCPEVYDTGAGGIAAAVGGGVLLVGALTMAITGWPPGPVDQEAP